MPQRRPNRIRAHHQLRQEKLLAAEIISYCGNGRDQTCVQYFGSGESFIQSLMNVCFNFLFMTADHIISDCLLKFQAAPVYLKSPAPFGLVPAPSLFPLRLPN